MKKEKIFLGVFIILPIISLIPLFWGLNFLCFLFTIAIFFLGLVIHDEIHINVHVILSFIASTNIIQMVNGIIYANSHINNTFLIITALITVVILFSNLTRSLFNNDKIITFYQVLEVIPIILVGFPLILLLDFWGSDFVWYVVGLYFITLITSEIFDMKRLRILLWKYKVRSNQIFLLYIIIAIVTATISTSIQYWGIVVKLAVFTSLAITIIFFLFRIQKRRKIKAEKAKKAEIKKIEAEKAKKAEIKKIEAEKAKIENDRKIFLESLNDSDSLDWRVVKNLFSIKEIPPICFTKKPVFFEYSNFKKQIVFQRDLIYFIIDSLFEFYKSTNDDGKLSEAIGLFSLEISQEMKNKKEFFGYSALITEISSRIKKNFPVTIQGLLLR